MRQHAQDNEIFDSIVTFTENPLDPEYIMFNKLSDLIDSYSYVPLIVKKNKNESGNLYQIFYSNKKHNPIVSIKSYNLLTEYQRERHFLDNSSEQPPCVYFRIYLG